jgi:hypothetical protein
LYASIVRNSAKTILMLQSPPVSSKSAIVADAPFATAQIFTCQRSPLSTPH